MSVCLHVCMHTGRQTDIQTDRQTDRQTNRTGPSTKTALIRPAKTKLNLVMIFVNLQEWAAKVLIDPLEYVVAYLFRELCGFNK